MCSSKAAPAALCRRGRPVPKTTAACLPPAAHPPGGAGAQRLDPGDQGGRHRRAQVWRQRRAAHQPAGKAAAARLRCHLDLTELRCGPSACAVRLSVARRMKQQPPRRPLTTLTCCFPPCLPAVHSNPAAGGPRERPLPENARRFPCQGAPAKWRLGAACPESAPHLAWSAPACGWWLRVAMVNTC